MSVILDFSFQDIDKELIQPSEIMKFESVNDICCVGEREGGGKDARSSSMNMDVEVPNRDRDTQDIQVGSLVDRRDRESDSSRSLRGINGD